MLHGEPNGRNHSKNDIIYSHRPDSSRNDTVEAVTSPEDFEVETMVGIKMELKIMLNQLFFYWRRR
jgi:hypothetical protein